MLPEEFAKDFLALLKNISATASLTTTSRKRKKYQPRRKCQGITICGKALEEAQALKQKLSEGRETPLTWTDLVARLLAVYKRYEEK